MAGPAFQRLLLGLGLLVGLGCQDQTPAKEPDAREAKKPQTTSPQVDDGSQIIVSGRWKGSTTCLELYATGEFELSTFGMGPKVVLTGGALQEQTDPERIKLTLRTSRIRRLRWIGKCREEVRAAALLDEHSVLGTEISLTTTSTLTLRPLGKDRAELCGRRCEVLTSEPLQLSGQWRKQGLRSPAQGTVGWAAGEPLQLELGSSNASLWIGAEGRDFYRVYSQAETRSLASGQYEITISPSTISLGAELLDQTQEIRFLGAPLKTSSARVFTARRVRGGVKLCGADGECTVLPHYDDLM